MRDEYLPESLKTESYSKRGKGIRRRVEPSSVIPINWQALLRTDDNKIELLFFLATTVVTIQTENSQQIITTHRKNALFTQPRGWAAPCSHEEADTRIILHLEDAVRQGYTKILIGTVDTELLVLAVKAAQRLDIAELLIALGVARNFPYLSAHQMANALGQERSVVLHMFHAFTGCDTVSFFNGRGQKTAWETWSAFDYRARSH